jgi:hypothetical protein
MRSLLLWTVLGAATLGLFAVTPGTAEAQQWRWNRYYSGYPAYSYAPWYYSYPGYTEYYPPSYSNYYTPGYSSAYYPPVYRSYYYGPPYRSYYYTPYRSYYYYPY